MINGPDRKLGIIGGGGKRGTEKAKWGWFGGKAVSKEVKRQRAVKKSEVTPAAAAWGRNEEPVLFWVCRDTAILNTACRQSRGCNLAPHFLEVGRLGTPSSFPQHTSLLKSCLWNGLCSTYHYPKSSAFPFFFVYVCKEGHRSPKGKDGGGMEGWNGPESK